MRCARCVSLWFAEAAALVPDLPATNDLHVVDSESLSDDPQPPAAIEVAPEPEVSVWWADLDEAAPEDPATPAEASDPAPEPASTEGIDIGALRAEIEVGRIEQAASADAGRVHARSEKAASMVAVESGRKPDAAAATDAIPDENIEPISARRFRATPPPRRRWPRPGLRALIVALVATDALLVGWRADVVRQLPQTASLYAAIGMPVNLRGLAFDHVKISKQMHDGVAVMMIEGSIVNIAAKPVEVPRLRLAIRNGGGNEIYSWTATPERSILKPAETLAFRSRLASPPADAQEVVVRFFSGHDVFASLR